MSQGLRDMLANRRFAIPLIVLLAFCFVGLILVGVVLILKPGAPDADEPVAEVTDAPGLEVTGEATEEVTAAPTATEAPTRRPTPTLVPVGTLVDSGSESTPASSTGGDETPTTAATTEPTATAEETAEATSAPVTDEELADTGIGWGLVLFAGVGLAGLAIAARRFRMA